MGQVIQKKTHLLNGPLQKKFQSSNAILFDMDGVITDTMPAHCQAWIRTLREFFKIEVPEIEIYRREGEKSDKSVPEILAKYGALVLPGQLQEAIQAKADLFNKLAGKKVFYPGIASFLKKISRYKTLALVTGTQKKEVERMLSGSFRHLFKVVITCNDVEHGKPDPEPYLKAQDLLQVSPQESLVIENAPLGIQSAKSAGIQVCALATSLPKEELTTADYLCRNHTELFALRAES